MAGNLIPNDPNDALQPAGAGLPQLADEALPPMAPVEADEGVQWGRYIAALKRYKWLMLAVVIVGTGLGILATRFLHPEYTAQATIWIEPEPERTGPVREAPVIQSFAWVQFLQTYQVIGTVVEQEHLYLQPQTKVDAAVFDKFQLADRNQPGDYVLALDANQHRYTLSTSDGVTVESGQLGDSIGRAVGFKWQPPLAALNGVDEIKFTVQSPRDASNALLGRLTPQMADNGNFLQLMLTGTDPRQITSTLNTLVNVFVEKAAELKRQKSSETVKALALQKDSTYQAYQEALSALEHFKVNTITKPTEGTPVAGGIQLTQPTVISNYFGQKLQLEQIRRDRQALKAVLDRAKSGAITVDAFQQIPTVQNAPDLKAALADLTTAEDSLRRLQNRYTDKSTQVQEAQARIQRLRQQTIPAYANALIGTLDAQESMLGKQIASASSELQSIPTRTITEQRLMGEVNNAAGLYSQVAARYMEAKLAEASAIPDVKAMDPAVQPQKPSSNTAPRIVFMAFMASIGLAVGLAILLDQLDKRFRYPDQVTRELGLSILGAIPAIRRVKPGERDAEEASQVIEAFRTVRMNLAHSYGAAGPVLLTITSPGAGDGKSLVSSNLALSFAEAGYKTLLIDGDIRRGELHRMFNVDRRPGLLDLLVGQSQLDQVLRPTTHRNLTMIPCGTRHQHGPELLGSNAMRSLIATLKSRYNVVIVDSPPLGAGIDPFVLATATGHMMLVLRSGETDRQMAEAKLKLLDRLPVRILGAVLNDIQTSGVYKYYSYIYGYTSDEEPTPQLTGGSVDTHER
ncbi:MAG TPA: polysaccharide biosynthesis tyrosine autokinase [Gemmatimonadales bacterium]|nr:polysaccharide biosynthesis tyrosine autokinase [Gemmatimonadales bacterium]